MMSVVAMALLLAEPNYSVEETIEKCAEIADRDARLFCFDQLSDALTPPAQTAETVAPPSSSLAGKNPRNPRACCANYR